MRTTAGSSDSKNFTIDLASRPRRQLPGERDLRRLSADAVLGQRDGAGGLNSDACSFLLEQHERGNRDGQLHLRGDANHTGSSDSKNFTIDLASSTTVSAARRT
jgi:hypothetical protein